MKNCPFCAEQIQDAAVVCKHCGRDLPGGTATATTEKTAAYTPPEKPSPIEPTSAPKDRRTTLALLIILAVATVVFLLQRSTSRRSPPADSPAPLPARVVRFDVSPQIDIPAGKFESFKWDVLPAQPNCRLTGHLEVVDGGNRDVQVFVLGDDDFANLVNGHGARAFFQTEKTTAVTLDVRTKAVGRMVLAISNAFSSVTAKRVELRGLLVTCR